MWPPAGEAGPLQRFRNGRPPASVPPPIHSTWESICPSSCVISASSPFCSASKRRERIQRKRGTVSFDRRIEVDCYEVVFVRRKVTFIADSYLRKAYGAKDEICKSLDQALAR